MLVALVTLLLLGGGGGVDVFSKEARKHVQEVVVDDARADAVVAEMKSAQKSLNNANKEIGKLFKSWGKADSDLDSQGVELESRLRQADGLRSEAMSTFTDSLFLIRDQMTAEEWAALHREPSEDG